MQSRKNSIEEPAKSERGNVFELLVPGSLERQVQTYKERSADIEEGKKGKVRKRGSFTKRKTETLCAQSVERTTITVNEAVYKIQFN